MNNTDIIERLKKSLEFYQELGFESLPGRLVQKCRNTAVQKYNKEQNSNCRPFPLAPFPLPLNKDSALKSLRDEIGDCQRCKLCRNRTNIVFGEGSPDAKIIFIGEGPGRDEDLQARPFVGEAGQLLTRLIEKLGMKREDVYIANIVKCRPPNNREPEADEITTCKPFVEKQIEIIKPKLIVSLGKVSSHALAGNKIPISKMRGIFFEYHNIPLMPTFHPAYLLRNPKDKWLTWDDMQKVLEQLTKTGS
ncbi:MAG: uracil-DNA glycosylase [Nitrospirae bacterium]|nr:uracil-DNA glycosylase [Nitrospirota bacterium]